jgi:5-methylcytosine-specific restriction endonuclease McrA
MKVSQESPQSFEEVKRKATQKNTFNYLENYLNPNKKWDKEITPRQRMHRIRFANVNWVVVSDHIKEMNYQNFLKTPYWKAITAHTKYKAGYRCQLCNNVDNLVTHHRDYAIHGFEHAHLQELIALCNNCHNKFHNYSTNRNNRLIFALAILSILAVYFLIDRSNVLWRLFPHY